MNLFLLGATGGIGRALLERGLERGHTVTAFVRTPEKLGARRRNLHVVQGDPRSEAELAAALPGHDAVLSALGPPGAGRTTIHQDAARSTLAAMEVTGVRRLLVVSAAVLFEGSLVRWLFRKTFLANIAADTSAMERLVTASDLEWTIARPPMLGNGPASHRCRAERDRLPRGSFRLSRADVAEFFLDELDARAHVRQTVGLSRQ